MDNEKTCQDITQGQATGLSLWASRTAGINPDDVQNVKITESCDVLFEVWNPLWPNDEYRLQRKNGGWNLQEREEVSGGCGASSYEKFVDTGYQIHSFEKFFTDEQHVVVVDEKVTDETAKFCLDILPTYIENIRELFGLDSLAYGNHVIFNLLDAHYYPGWCGDGSDCAGNGVVWCFAEYYFENINFEAKKGSIDHVAHCFTHELSHAVRYRFPWWGLEEGLAEYIKYRLIQDIPKIPEDTAGLLFNMEFTIGESVGLNESASEYIEKIGVKDIGQDGVTLIYSLRKKVKDGPPLHVDIELFYKFDEYFELYNILIKTESLGSDVARVIAYKRAEWPKDIIRSSVSCNNDGSSSYVDIATDDGVATVYSYHTEYEKLDNYEDGPNRFSYYTTAYCFWDMLEQEYGREAVVNIVRSIEEFAELNPDTSFSKQAFENFVESFIFATGMTKTMRKEYFDQFSVPLEYSEY